MPFQRIARCPVCREQIDVLESPDREPNGMGEAMVLGESRREHALKSPKCVGEPGWGEGWTLDEPVEVPARPAVAPQTGVGQMPRGSLVGHFHVNWVYQAAGGASAETNAVLDAHALSRAVEMYSQGFREGELHCSVGDDEFHGWWSLAQ